MTRDQDERITKALESIAESLARLANPPLYYADGQIHLAPGFAHYVREAPGSVVYTPEGPGTVQASPAHRQHTTGAGR